MAWFGDGLPSLSNLKGQLTSFTKEVLSEGIVEEIDERSRALNEANERCVVLQELLDSKDAEISLLRRQNCELEKAVIELNAKPKEPNDIGQDEVSEAFFWDPPSTKNQNSKNQNHVRQLQEQLAQATMKIRELESELKRIQKINASSLKDEIPDGHQKAEFLRAKQDMVNRIIQMEEKTREAERHTKRVQLDETILINDFRTIISKLNSLEKLDLVRGALKALETENEKSRESNEQEKSDFHEKLTILSTVAHESAALKPNFDINSDPDKRNDGFVEASSNRELELQKKIEELQEENRNLFASIEELDKQHTESIENLLSLKEELEKKHQCLQRAYEQLYVEYNEAQDKVLQVENKLAESNKVTEIGKFCRYAQTSSLRNEDRDIQPDSLEMSEEDGKETDVLDELTRKMKDILKNSCIETGPEESIFEAVAKQYVDVKWKKDVLEKRVTELTRELKEGAEMRESLQVECDDMQAHIDSLLLEIQDLKLNLPSIPEASEERVASLESETESLQEVVKGLQCENDRLRGENMKLRKTRENGESIKSPEIMDRVSETVADNESAMENLNRRLNATLDENSELRKKIDLLENTEKQMQEQLGMSLQKCKGLDENIEIIEELKLDLENVKRELKVSVSNTKRLENSLTDLQNAKSEIEKENEDLFQRKEQLEAEISKWHEVNLEKGNNNVLLDLQERLSNVTCEKNDLEYDILNMRKELDAALNRIDENEHQMAILKQETESLTKERHSLLERLTGVQDESNDRIDLLNTEKSLLEQEHAELKEVAMINEEKLKEIHEKLREMEEKNMTLESRLLAINAKAENPELENKNLRDEMEKYKQLRDELHNKSSKLNELYSMQSEYAEMKDQLEILRSKEIELSMLQENFVKIADENATLKSLQEPMQNHCKRLEAEIACLQNQMQENLHRAGENDDDSEKQRIVSILEEKVRENETLRNENGKLINEIIESQNKLEKVIESNKESADMAKETIESLSHLIRQKDEEVNSLKAAFNLRKDEAEIPENFTTLKNERDELVKLVTVKHNESLQYHGEIQKLTQLLNEQASRIQNITSELDASSSLLAEKDAELLWTRNELQVLQQRLKNLEGSNCNETCGIVGHSSQAAEIAILNEKCDALEAALIQEQSNNRMLQNQLIESQSKEANAGRELERLRSHLVEMESNYTEEALIAEETRKELEAKLQHAEEKMKNSSTVYTSASIRANQQVETLQQQMALIVQQRDDIQSKLSAAEDKVLSQTASLTNLQIVLEQFQRDKERDILSATERIHSKLNDSYRKHEELLNEITNLKDQLAEAKECLQAASRLSGQLEKKTERIEQLTQEVERLTELANTADRRIEEAKQSGEGKVDKYLVKNLLLGYLTSPGSDKSSVLRVFSTVLDFNETERDKAGLNNATAQSSWFSRLHGGSTTTKDQEASLTAAFVRFLESESKPKPQLPALPIQTSPLPRPGHSRQDSSSSTQSTLLLSNVNLPTFPDFIPARSTGSILKEVLKDS